MRTDKLRPVPPGVMHMERLQQFAGLAARDVKKIDRFSLLALAAAKSVLDETELTAEDRMNCGIINGNMVAGWTFTEPQLRALYRSGLQSVSPYLATAWFPAAPQGQVTIHLKIRGVAKTVTTDRCAGAQAIGLGYEHIRTGRSKLLLAGGVEAPLTPFVKSVPQHAWMNGQLSEGAAYLLLSSQLEAPMAILAHETFPVHGLVPLPHELLQRRLLRLWGGLRMDCSPSVVICNVPADTPLEEAVHRCVAEILPGAAVMFPTRAFGETLAASGAIAVTIACAELAALPNGGIAVALSLGHQCCDLLCVTKLSGGYSHGKQTC